MSAPKGKVPLELIKYLKPKPSGDEAVRALKLRTQYAITHWRSDPMVRRVFSYAAEIPPGRVLDVGCYGGWLYHHLYKKSVYVGIDNWPEAIQAARELFPEGDFRLIDVMDFKEPMDFVWCSQLSFGNDVVKIVDHLKNIGRHGIAILMSTEADLVGENEKTSQLGIVRW